MLQNQLQQELNQIVTRIVDGYQPKKIILFGSAARGDMRKDSDIDLFIIKDDPDKRPFRAVKVYGTLDGFDRLYPLDVIVYTPSELEYRQSLGDYFVKNVLMEGKVVYEQ